MSRLPEVAVYSAMLPRDGQHDGGVLILDRNALRFRFHIDVRHCGDWDGCGHGPAYSDFDEAEEAIWSDVPDLHRYLIGVVPITESFSSEAA